MIKNLHKRFKIISFIQFICSCGLFYSGLKFALYNHSLWIFGIMSLLVLPFGIWMGTMLIKSLRPMIKENIIWYKNRWDVFAGPRALNLILYLMMISGIVLMVVSHRHRFSGFEDALAMEGKQDSVSFITTIILSVSSTLWVITTAEVLIWCSKYEKRSGKALYREMLED